MRHPVPGTDKGKGVKNLKFFWTSYVDGPLASPPVRISVASSLSEASRAALSHLALSPSGGTPPGPRASPSTATTQLEVGELAVMVTPSVA